jgi:hypothetical protein
METLGAKWMENESNGNVVVTNEDETAKPVVTIDPNAVIRYDADSLDADGFVSLWNVASATMNADLILTRALAARFLGFLCKHQCSFVVTSSSDAKYLDERFERDNKLLYNWAIDSETVDVMSQHAYVPAVSFLNYLKTKKFDPTSNYSPRRLDRVKWFTDEWCVG